MNKVQIFNSKYDTEKPSYIFKHGKYNQNVFLSPSSPSYIEFGNNPEVFMAVTYLLHSFDEYRYEDVHYHGRKYSIRLNEIEL